MATFEFGAESARLDRDTYKEVTDDADQIRLVILGQSGIGKSTIVSRVFGIPEEEARVSHGVPGEHDVTKGITYKSNRCIVVHDSGDFLGGAAYEVEQVKGFISNRRNQKLVKDQIHCICMRGDRPTQGFTDKFMADIDEITGDIPVLLIFTKYDRLLAQHKSLLGDQNPEWPHAKVKNLAEGQALKAFESEYLKIVMSKLKKCKKKVDWERVGRLQSPERGGAMTGDPYNETGANELISKTEASLEYSLRPMWVRTQRQNAAMKIDASVTAGMKFFKQAAFFNGIPFVPGKDLAVEMVTSNKIFTSIHAIWNQDEFLFHADGKTQTRMREAIFDQNIVQAVASQVWDIFDITGPLSQANNAVKFMKTVAGVTLLHGKLFWHQKARINTMSTFSVNQGHRITEAGVSKLLPLNSDQVNEIVLEFQNSSLRENMCAHIDGKLVEYGLNLKTAFSPTKVEKIIRDALKVSQGLGGSLD